MTTPTKRGFALMDPERQRAISKKGGASVPASKRSFSKDTELAKEAARKGGSSGKKDDKTEFKSHRGAVMAAVRRGIDPKTLGPSEWVKPGWHVPVK